MRSRVPTARVSSTSSRALVCAALTAYGTWPAAPAAASEAEVALRTSSQIIKRATRALRARPPEPLALRLAHVIAEPGVADATSQIDRLPLRLSLAIGAARAGPERDPALPIDLALAQPVFYGIRVNRQDYGVTRLLRLPDGRWMARRSDLEEWRVRLPDVKPLIVRGEEHFLLSAYEGVLQEVDEARQELALEFPPRYFATTVLDSIPARAVPTPPVPGGFANYDLTLSALEGEKRFGGLFEAGVFNRLGVGVSSFLASEVGGPDRRFVRLDTTWTRDFPEDMKTLILGDAIGSSGIWGRPVRFGGVRYGTNFATNPGFITFPLPALRGEAALPTTTELYVDGVLRQSGSMPPGPFRMNNVPVLTGQGEVRLVVRDLLGREQIINVPYYTSSQLLKAGLTEESNEFGFVREDFGLRSNNYGRAVAAFQRRKGFTEALTAEGRVEILRQQQTAGAGGSVAVPKIGVMTGALATSHSEMGVGVLGAAAFERQTWRGLSFGVRSQWTSEKFTQLGLQPNTLAPRRVMSGSVGFSPVGYGSFGFAYIRQDNRDTPGTELVAATYSLSLPRGSAVVVSAFKPLSGEGTAAVSITFAIAFGERHSAFVGYTGQAQSNEFVAQVQQNLPAGSGTGYRALAGVGAQGDREELGFSMQTTAGTYMVEAGRASDRMSYRAGASGAVALIDGRAFLARSVTESFGVAHIPGFENVGVYVNNQPVARTDKQGYAMLPRLLPYQPNAVRVELGDLPLDTQIEATELNAVPYFRSGMLMKFPMQRANGALLTLLLETGEPMPVGSVVRVAGSPQEFPVAERGQAYLTGLGEKNRISVSWRGQSCELVVDISPEALGGVPRIKPLTCAGVKR